MQFKVSNQTIVHYQFVYRRPSPTDTLVVHLVKIILVMVLLFQGTKAYALSRSHLEWRYIGFLMTGKNSYCCCRRRRWPCSHGLGNSPDGDTHQHFHSMSLSHRSQRISTFRVFSSLSLPLEQTFNNDCDDVAMQSVKTEKLPRKALFKIKSNYEPTGDQPQAIAQLCRQLDHGDKYSILQGITGTGKTFVMSHIIAHVNQPCLVLCHNKTLAAQLARELRSFLPENAVELFVSHFNHYLPESYNETTGNYIDKKSSINETIDALRHRATCALVERQDVVVVSSVSCIYGLGLPTEYIESCVELNVGDLWDYKMLLRKIGSELIYEAAYSDATLQRGQYQLKYFLDGMEVEEMTEAMDGEPNALTLVIMLCPPKTDAPLKIILQIPEKPSIDGDKERNSDCFRVASIQSGTRSGMQEVQSTMIFPAIHYVTTEDQRESACRAIEEELKERVKELTTQQKDIEAERLMNRTTMDLMKIRERGFCKGAENYSRHFAGRAAGEAPDTLLDYMGHDWLLLVDESHVTLSQLKTMYSADRKRKESLVKHGYRLPSALDNRPLKDAEFWERVQRCVLVSATPGQREKHMSERDPVPMGT